MPPQDQQNQVPPVAPVPPAPATPPTPPAPGVAFSADSLKSNQKLIETVKTFVIYGTIMYVANAIINIALSSLNWSSSYSYFSVGTIITSIIMGAIFSAIGGAIFYYIYGPVHEWIKRNGFLSKHITDMFSLFWKPFLVGTIISLIFGILALLPLLGIGAGMAALGGVGFGGLFIGIIIGFVAHIIIYYFYCKAMAAKLAPLYVW